MTLRTTILTLTLAPSLAVGAAAVAQVVTPQDITAPSVAGSEAPLVEAHDRRGGGERGGKRGGRRGGFGMFPGGFEQVDADGDGAVTQAEVDAFVAALVGGADSDGDGGLTLDEFRALAAEATQESRGRREARAFQALDADASGTITAEEIDERFGDIVARMDRDGDGALSREDRGGRGERGSR